MEYEGNKGPIRFAIFFRVGLFSTENALPLAALAAPRYPENNSKPY
jgi:hypothetical protein